MEDNKKAASHEAAALSENQVDSSLRQEAGEEQVKHGCDTRGGGS